MTTAETGDAADGATDGPSGATAGRGTAAGRSRSLIRDPVVGPLAWSQLISALGSAMVGLAIVYVSYDTSNSIFHTVLVTASYTLPSALLAPVAGRLSQHHSRRRIMLVTYAAKMAVYVLMAAIAFAGELDANVLIVLSFLSGSISAITYPAWAAFERDVIDVDDLDRANALFSSMSSAAKLVGAVGGGVLIATVGSTTVFVLNALSFLPELAVLARLHPKEHIQSAAAGAKVGFGDAVRFIKGETRLRRALITLAALSLLAAPVGSLLPAIAADVSSSASALGVFTAVFSLGAIFVAEAVGRLKARYNRAQLVEVALLVCAVLLVAVGIFQVLFDDIALAIAVGLILVPVGLTIAMAQSVLLAITQVAAPDELAGEIMAVYGMTYSLLGPAGAILLGQVAEHVEVLYTLAVAGVVLIVYGVILLRWLARTGEPLPPPKLLEAHALGLTRHVHPFPGAVTMLHHPHGSGDGDDRPGDDRPGDDRPGDGAETGADGSVPGN